MPISISELDAERRTFIFETNRGPVKVTYRPYEMTPNREAEIARISDNVEDVNSKDGNSIAQTEAGLTRLIEQFTTVVEAWDLVGPLTNKVTGEIVVPGDTTIPVTSDICRIMSSYFLITVLNAVMEDCRPKKGARNS